MALSGKIEDFSIVDTIQYIHSSRKSGILSLKNGENSAEVHYRNGEIIRVIKPDLKNIGNILCEQGRITFDAMKQVAHLQESAREEKAVGVILQEMGFATREDIKEALIQQITQVIDDLVKWEVGDFSFTVMDLFHPDNIVVSLSDLALPEEMNTEFLLMEAIRKFDEARSGIKRSTHREFQDQNGQLIEFIVMLNDAFDFDPLIKEIPDFPLQSISVEKPASFDEFQNYVFADKKAVSKRIILCELSSGKSYELWDRFIRGLSIPQKKKLSFIIIGKALEPAEIISLYFHGVFFVLPQSDPSDLEIEHRFKILLKKILTGSVLSKPKRSAGVEENDNFPHGFIF